MATARNGELYLRRLNSSVSTPNMLLRMANTSSAFRGSVIRRNNTSYGLECVSSIFWYISSIHARNMP